MELTKRAIKFTQQIMRKDTAPSGPFEDLKHELEKLLIHLQNLSIPELESGTSGVSQVCESSILHCMDMMN